MIGRSRRTRWVRSVIGQFLAFGIGVGLMLVLLGMILGLEADMHPGRFAGTAADLVQHTQHAGMRVMITLLMCGVAIAVAIVLIGLVGLSFPPRRAASSPTGADKASGDAASVKVDVDERSALPLR